MGIVTIKRLMIAVAALVAVVSVAYLTGRRDGRNRAALNARERVDTLFVVDTIVAEKPVLVEKTKVEKVLVPIIDTLRIHDTTFVYLDREQVVWQDSLSRVYASGILPQVDSVHHFIRERVVTRELTNVVKKPCKWGLGVHAGYGIMIGREMTMSPYIGVGISYNIMSW